MSVVVSLDEIVDAMEAASDECEAYLDPESGEIVTVTGDDRSLLEEDEDPVSMPPWQRDMVARIRAALETDRYLPLPDQFEIDEWSMMDRFAQSRPGSAHADQLLDAIHGKGAYRQFRAAIDHHNLTDEWRRFRDEEFRTIARQWLNSHGLSHK